MSKRERVVEGSENVFADLGLPNPGAYLAKARIASQITDVIEAKGLTQTEASALLGIEQSKVSAILDGQLSALSLEQLIRCLDLLGKRITLGIDDKEPEKDEAGLLEVSVSRS